MHNLSEIRMALERRKGEAEQIQKRVSELSTNLLLKNRELGRYERAIEIVKQVGLQTQKQLEFVLAEQVSMALAAVFDDPYQLVVNFQSKRGKTEAELLFSRRKLLVPPIGFVGFGAIDVAALALRLAYWTMKTSGKTRSVLLLDEPFARLKGQQANMRALSLLNEISKQLKIQIIMISDERIPRDDIIRTADRVFLVTQEEGVSHVQVL